MSIGVVVEKIMNFPIFSNNFAAYTTWLAGWQRARTLAVA